MNNKYQNSQIFIRSFVVLFVVCMFVIILCAAGCAEKDVPLVLENEIENSSDSSDDSDNDSNDSLESQQNEEDNIPVEKVIEKTLGLVVDGYIHFPDGYKEKQYTD